MGLGEPFELMTALAYVKDQSNLAKIKSERLSGGRAVAQGTGAQGQDVGAPRRTRKPKGGRGDGGAKGEGKGT